MMQDNTATDGSTLGEMEDPETEGGELSDAERAAEQARMILLLLDDML